MDFQLFDVPSLLPRLRKQPPRQLLRSAHDLPLAELSHYCCGHCDLLFDIHFPITNGPKGLCGGPRQFGSKRVPPGQPAPL